LKDAAKNILLKIMRLKLLVVILLVGASLVQAQESKNTTPAIQKGSTFLNTYLEYFDNVSVFNLNVERGCYPLKPLSLIGGLHMLFASGYRVYAGYPRKTKDTDVLGLGFAGTVRYDLVRVKRSALFIDASLGFLLCTDKFPPDGTFWNFTQRYTAGVSLKIHKKVNLLMGARHLHVSNAGYKRNPSYDGNGPFAGVMFGF
jgi:hypothetical protein